MTDKVGIYQNLAKSVLNNDAQSVSKILRSNPRLNLNKEVINKFTIAHIACRYKSIDTLRILLRYEIDLFIRDTGIYTIAPIELLSSSDKKRIGLSYNVRARMSKTLKGKDYETVIKKIDRSLRKLDIRLSLSIESRNKENVESELGAIRRATLSAEQAYNIALKEYNKEKPNYKKIVTSLIFASGRGYMDAQYLLGCIYYHGEHVDKNNEEAISLFKDAALLGHANSSYQLYLIYNSLRGMEEEAKIYLKEGARREHPAAMYYYAAHRKQDYEKHIAGRGNNNCFGRILRREVIYLLRKSADFGNLDGQYQYGVYLYSGKISLNDWLSTGADQQLAQEYLQKAKGNGHYEAGQMLENIREYTYIKHFHAHGYNGFKKKVVFNEDRNRTCIFDIYSSPENLNTRDQQMDKPKQTKSRAKSNRKI